MSIKREKFINTLKPMFEADKAELDFGVYKIINQKREQINDFLDNKLSKDIEQQLSDLCSNEEEKINTEEKVYSHLTNFFGRYYDEGDFISKRRYKEGVYAIPYEGEEVKLYWANHDQYYIKSAENFKDYSFKLGESKKVNFKLVEAAPEINNNKALDENKLFVLKECDNFISIDNNEMTINFEYVGFPKTTKQDKLNKETLDKIIKFIESKISQEEYREFYTALRALDPTPKNKKRTVLEKELAIYTSKNSFDYFIHKDLGGFLRRELDFYIKNEVLFIDDIGTENEKYLMDYVNQVKIIKCIANKIIKFLEQIENFQKKLWLKKKFVVESNYCITLDRIHKKFYSEIASNENQIKEWVELFDIDESNVDEEFLEENPYLLLDTKFFDEDFKEKVIARFDNLDEETNGLLIHSDNFQALNTIENKYNNSIDMIYIDPPYNTDSNEIIYKNNYKHSSFLSLINDRLNKSNKFLSDEGSMCCAIDKAEQKELGLLIQQNFADKDIHCITVIHNPRGIQGKNFSYTHEYVYYAIPKDKDIVLEQIIPQDEWKYDNLRNWGGESERKYGKTLFYPIYINSLTNEIIDVGDSPNDEYHPKNSNIYMDNNIVEVWPIDANGIERKWRYSKNKTLEDKEYMMIKTGSDGSLNIHAPKRTQRYKTMWNDSKYDASVYGKKMLTSMLPKSPFSFPKSLYTVKESLESITLNNRNAKIMDFFGGSGTTGHATIQLNREDKGSRKYILVEMGEYFNIVTKPRIQKAIYSSQWKNGKPVDRDGISHMFKYMNLEQYEDTLNNIVFDENKGIKNLNERLQEEYTLSYMLDMESKDSNALLNINKLTNPFEYKLNIERNNETNYRNIDLVETFNYLLGLHVEQISAKESYNYDGETIEKYDGGQYIFKRVEGKLRDNKKVLIVWRNLTDDIKTDNDVLNAYFDKKDITLDEYDYVYINGDNTIAINNYSNDKVKLIDEEFKTLMFDVDNI
ncbi:DNA methyltransferase [Romboutsia ilealis]|uniref:DNA methyltransferase n=1 Tax=Romboutsia ilealis TaxID=1115758 RepID=UPI0025B7571D|nr:DNA methyltransferase [Romboutsia ilealis]